MTKDDVLFEAVQVIVLACDCSFGQHLGGTETGCDDILGVFPEGFPQKGLIFFFELVLNWYLLENIA